MAVDLSSARGNAAPKTMKRRSSTCLCLGLLALAVTACRKPDPVQEMEKAAVAIEKLEKATPPAASGDYDPAKAGPPPAKQLKDAITDFKAGKMEDAVTRVQLLRSQTVLTPEQRMAVQDSIAALMAEIYALAEKGDARAAAAVAQYERMQTMRR